MNDVVKICNSNSFKRLGRDLRQVAVDSVKTQSMHIKSRWFHSGEDLNVFLWEDDKGLMIRHQFAFLGQIIEWNLLDGIRTGVIVEEELRGFKKYLASESIYYDREPSETALHHAAIILSHSEAINLNDRTRILDSFKPKNPSFLKALNANSQTTKPKNPFWFVSGLQTGLKNLLIQFSALLKKPKP